MKLSSPLVVGAVTIGLMGFWARLVQDDAANVIVTTSDLRDRNKSASWDSTYNLIVK